MKRLMITVLSVVLLLCGYSTGVASIVGDSVEEEGNSWSHSYNEDGRYPTAPGKPYVDNLFDGVGVRVIYGAPFEQRTIGTPAQRHEALIVDPAGALPPWTTVYYSNRTLQSTGIFTMWSAYATGPEAPLTTNSNMKVWFFGTAVPERYELFLYHEGVPLGGIRWTRNSGGGWGYVDIPRSLAAPLSSIVPEPATILVWSLLGLAVAASGIWRRKRAA